LRVNGGAAGEPKGRDHGAIRDANGLRYVVDLNGTVLEILPRNQPDRQRIEAV